MVAKKASSPSVTSPIREFTSAGVTEVVPHSGWKQPLHFTNWHLLRYANS